jgi:Phytanoyl-CoA dioxygenase (PhyH)
LFAPAVLDLVECIIGPDIVLWLRDFIRKDPFIGGATPWHEDSTYWSGRLDQYFGHTMRHVSAEVKVVPEKNIGHRLWLARGRPGADDHYENV